MSARIRKGLPACRQFAAAVLGLAVLAGCYALSQFNYLLFHTLVETFSAIVACAVFMLFWNTRRFANNGFFLFIGIACLFAGVFDLLHAFTFNGMSVLPNALADESLQLKTAGRWMASFSFLIAPLFLRRRLNVAVALGIYGSIFTLVLYCIFAGMFPACYLSKAGMTRFEQTGRAESGIVFLVAAGLLLSQRSEFAPRVLFFLVASLVVSATSEFASSLAVHSTTLAKVVGHLLEVVSLYLVYKAFVEVGLTRPYDLVFRRLVESGEKLRLHVKQSSLAVIEWDADFRVAAWNPAAERTFGYAAAEALGQHASFIVPSRARPAVDGVWDRLSREQAGTESTNENLTKDGRTILCAWHNTPLTNAKRQFVGVTSLAEDVTERRRLEEKNRHLAVIVESSDDAIIGETLDGTITSWNKGAEEIFGYRESEVIGKPISCLVPPGRPGELPQLLRSVRRGEAVEHHETVRRRKDGSDVNVSLTISPIKDGDGQIVGASAIGRDITERKRLEESLRANERRYRLLAEHVADVIWTMDFSGRFTYMSPSVEQMLGFKWQDGGRLTLADIVTPQSLGLALATLETFVVEAKAGRRQHPRFELELFRKDGSFLWAEIAAGPLYAESGEIVGAIGVTRDISERQRAESNQRLATEVLRVLNRGGDRNDMIGKTLRLIRESLGCDAVGLRMRKDDDYPYYEQIGFSDDFLREEKSLCAKGGDGAIVRDADGRAILECTCGLVLAGRTDPSMPCYTEGGSFWTNVSSELLALPPEADPRTNPRNRCIHAGYQSVALVPLQSGTEIIGLLQLNDRRKGQFSPESIRFFEGLATSIGLAVHRKLAEEELWRSKEEVEQYAAALESSNKALGEFNQIAESATRAKSQFLANMSHEIRTPMTAILGYADLLRDPTVDDSTRNNYLGVIQRNGEHLLTLISDILDLSKIEAGKLSLDLRRSNVRTLLADVAGLLRHRAEQRGIALAVECKTRLPETIWTDEGRLRQALINLVGNAVKFTAKGGVRIVASWLPEWNHGPAMRFEVIDTGIGIAAATLSRLFQPFAQGDQSISRKFGGTGLGLAITRHIARLLDGDLSVASVPDQGSTFVLTVPTGSLEGVTMVEQRCAAEPGSASPAEPATIGDLDGIHLLLAEDGYDNRELIRIVLRRAGATVETVKNGREAVAKAQAESFDAILMDINMPVMDGYTATQVLRDGGYRGPILALTANAMSTDAERCIAAGCNAHLAKPINRAELIRTIAATVMGRPSQTRPTHQEDAVAGDGRIVSRFAEDPDVAGILEGFVARLADQVDAMGLALVDRRFSELQRSAHQLKGAGGCYGYPMLTAASKILEDAATTNDFAAAERALDAIAALSRAIRDGYNQTRPAESAEYETSSH